jgi:hypothetical protein
MARKIIVASATGNRAKTFETSVGTWGELKATDGFSELYNSGLEAIVSTTKATLNRDEAVLPDGDFNIFLVAKKNKAGITISEALYSFIDDEVADSDIDDEDVNAVLEVVKASIETFFGSTQVAASTTQTAEDKALAEAKKFL